MKKDIKNIRASIRAKLQNKAKETRSLISNGKLPASGDIKK